MGQQVVRADWWACRWGLDRAHQPDLPSSRHLEGHLPRRSHGPRRRVLLHLHAFILCVSFRAPWLVSGPARPSALELACWSRHVARPCSKLLTLISLLPLRCGLDRFFGWTENSREVKKDYAEMRAKAERNEPLYGTTKMTEYQQGASMRATMGSQVILCASLPPLVLQITSWD